MVGSRSLEGMAFVLYVSGIHLSLAAHRRKSEQGVPRAHLRSQNPYMRSMWNGRKSKTRIKRTERTEIRPRFSGEEDAACTVRNASNAST